MIHWWGHYSFTILLRGYTYMTWQIFTTRNLGLQVVWAAAWAEVAVERWPGERSPERLQGPLGVGVGFPGWQRRMLLLLHFHRLQRSPVDFKNQLLLFCPLIIVLNDDLLALLQMYFSPGGTDDLVLPLWNLEGRWSLGEPGCAATIICTADGYHGIKRKRVQGGGLWK